VELEVNEVTGKKALNGWRNSWTSPSVTTPHEK